MADHSGERGLREDLERRLDEYRILLLESLDDLAEDEARAEVVAGQPSLLGIVRHVAFVEGVWFDEAITGRSRQEIGIPVATASSLKVRKSDSIESIRDEYRRRSDSSRQTLSDLQLDDRVSGRGDRYVREVMVHVLSELAWRTGQASILREVVISSR